MADTAVQSDLQLYLKQINEVELLTPEEEKELGWRVINDNDFEAKDRMIIMQSLAEVIRSDERVSRFETDYFDLVANALKATPSELSGLVPEGPQLRSNLEG